MKRILLIEDEDAIAKALKDWIVSSHSNYEMEVASDGLVALRKIINGSFDLILLDLVMPTMDGFQFLEELIRRGIKANVIVLTNLDSEEDKKKALDMGVLGYFVKNETELKKLSEKIESVLA